mgnify:CR=1 FL=1
MSLRETDKVIINNRLKHFLFRWHIKSLFKRLIAEEKTKTKDNLGWVLVASEIHNKCKHDVESEVHKHLQPYIDKIKDLETLTQD